MGSISTILQQLITAIILSATALTLTIFEMQKKSNKKPDNNLQSPLSQ